MSVIATHLETNTGVSAASFQTGNLALLGNKVILVAVASTAASGSANTPTPSLTGWTFNQVNSVPFGSGNPSRITLFTGIGAGTGAITFDFAAQSQSACGWSITQFSNTKVSGTGGSSSVVQNATNSANSGATGYTVTLAAFSSTNNATFSCVSKEATNNVSPGTGYTELGEATATGFDIESMWRSDNNTTPNASFIGSGGDAYGAIAVEIAYASSTGLIGDI